MNSDNTLHEICIAGLYYRAGYATASNTLSWTELTSWNQADVKMHGFQQVVYDKSVATDVLQVDCQDLLSTGLLQVASTSCNKSATDKLQQAWF